MNDTQQVDTYETQGDRTEGPAKPPIDDHSQAPKSDSHQDDANEPDLAQIAVNRNGDVTKTLSLLLTADDPAKYEPSSESNVFGRLELDVSVSPQGGFVGVASHF